MRLIKEMDNIAIKEELNENTGKNKWLYKVR